MTTEELRRYARHARDIARQHRDQAADETRPASQRLLATELAERAELYAALAERQLGGAS